MPRYADGFVIVVPKKSLGHIEKSRQDLEGARRARILRVCWR
jgi:hypothetical protein